MGIFNANDGWALTGWFQMGGIGYAGIEDAENEASTMRVINAVTKMHMSAICPIKMEMMQTEEYR